MAAKTPPDEYLSDWAAATGRISELSASKCSKGYNVSEAPGSAHLNYVFNRVGNWNEVTGRALASKMAFRNIDYTTIDPGPDAAVATNAHIDYDALADRWYLSGVQAGLLVYANDSADGVTWDTVNPSVTGGTVGNFGDASKIVTNGTFCAIAADNGTQARVYKSSDLTVANLDVGTNVGTSTTALESSDLTYDATNALWIWCGRSTTKGIIATASTPLGPWTNRKTFTTDTDAIALATNEVGLSVCSGNTETYYSSNGTTWSTAGTPAPITNNIVWAPSLNLFVCRENSTSDMWTSTTGAIWSDQNAVNNVPGVHNMVHCPDFFLMWGDLTASSGSNGNSFSDVYAFHTAAISNSAFNFQSLGQSWEDAVPAHSGDLSVYRGGQGKIIFPYNHVTPTSDFYLAIARYGAT